MSGQASMIPKVPFEEAARAAIDDTQLRRNLGKATSTIRAKRMAVVSELSDWEALRSAGAAIKDRMLARMDEYLLQLEEAVMRAGVRTVHLAEILASTEEEPAP